jgi:hypothetical protein
MVKGRCMKEKKEVAMQDVQYILMKNGRPAAKGVCPHDGTKMFKILAANEIPDDLKRKAEAWKASHKGEKRSRKSKKTKSGGRSHKSKKSKKSRKSHKSNK